MDPNPQDSPSGVDARTERLQDLLVKTSRTFALAIPQLPAPTVREVTIAYLLFRIADTFEDATVLWDRERRLTALADFGELLAAPSPAAARRLRESWLADPPTPHGGYLELLEQTPEVMEAAAELRPEAFDVIVRHTRRTARGMAGIVERVDERGVLRLGSIGDLRAYCYIVAGIVGEMLTELFVLGRPELGPATPYLRERAAEFGEGLQLVNILKDSRTDAGEGRNFIPVTVDRGEVFALARADLARAAEYTLAIQHAGGPGGIVAFSALPVELAAATLDRVERDGPGSKITRAEVFALHSRVHEALAAGRDVLATVAG